MKPPPFDYVAPRSLQEALEVLAEHRDEAQPIAGGQSLTAMMALRVARPALVVDLQHLPELRGIDLVEGGGLRIGAMTRQVEVLRSPVVAQHLPSLQEAVRLTGHFQTRNRGTIGGSVALGEPAAENPAYALALDAELELASASGRRTVHAADFYLGPYLTERADDELLVSITYRPPPQARIGTEEIMQRRGDFALAGIVACLEMNGDGVKAARFAWIGMASRPLRASAAEQAIAGRLRSEIDLGELAVLAIDGIDVVEDGHATAEYRRTAGAALFQRLLRRLLDCPPSGEKAHDR